MRYLCAVALACCAASFALLRESSAAPTADAAAAPATPGPAPGDADVPNGLQEDGTLLVPVARKFSSLKELFQILKEQRKQLPVGSSAPANDSATMAGLLTPRPNETLARDDSYVIFITD